MSARENPNYAHTLEGITGAMHTALEIAALTIERLPTERTITKEEAAKLIRACKPSGFTEEQTRAASKYAAYHLAGTASNMPEPPTDGPTEGGAAVDARRVAATP